ncbi:PAS domain-containing protein [Halobacteria archaeon AArc-dxtr1]|nr:PAS domain-containing protein [Halobacteria archaeon AArc-dxtr1]
MDTADGEHGEWGSPEQAAMTLEAITDPVVRVDGKTVTYGNRAAREKLNASEGTDPRSLPSWEQIGAAIDEMDAETIRTVDRATEQYDARIYRGVGETTIVYERASDRSSNAVDVKTKARVVDETPVGVVISDPSKEDNPLVYVNQAYQAVTGYSFEEAIGRNCRYLQGEDTDPETVTQMREAIEAEEPITVEIKNYRKDGTEFWNEVTIAPVYDDGTLTNYVGFQNDVTARKEAELEVQQRREQLEYILERVGGLVQDVTSAVAGSTSRSTLETAVCERIADEPAYDGVWIGEREPGTTSMDIRASTGVAPALPASEPVADEALAAGDVAVGSEDETTTIAVPLRYNEIEYGVLVVLTGGDREIDERETALLQALARTVASGINARETSRTLATDAVVAVDIDMTDPTLTPVALSEAANCRLEYRRSVHRTGAQTASLFTATGATAATLVEVGAERDELDVSVLVDREDACLIEVSEADGLVAWLAERGVRTKAIDATDGQARVTLELPRSANVRSVIESISDRYEGSDVVSITHREVEPDTRQEFIAQLEDELTDRQFTALQRAYLAGYFEWPRPATGEDVAQSMDVSRPTFHEHLRNAERKLCQAFFGDDYGL